MLALGSFVELRDDGTTCNLGVDWLKEAEVKRFGYEIRDADNKLVKSVNGFASRIDAESFAERKRNEIAQLGWNMRVYVTEAHKVTA